MSDSSQARATEPAKLALAVLGVAVLFNFVGRGLADSFTAFVLPLEQHFGWRRSEITGVFASYMLMNGLFAPFIGLIFDRFGPRVVYCLGLLALGLGALLASRAQALWHLYLSAGILVGIGVSATGQTCATALIARWYRARLATAIALVYAGAGLGMLVMVPLAQTLIEATDWRTTWQWLGVMALVLIPVCALLPWRRLARPAEGPEPDPSNRAGSTRAAGAASSPAGPRVVEALRTPAFWRLVQTFFFTAFANYLLTPQIVAYLIETGLPPILAASAYGLTGLLSTVGVVAAGWLSDRYGIQRVALLSLGSSITGIFGLFLASWFPGLAALALFVACFGLAQGARGPIVSALCNRIFAGPSAASINGLVFASLALGASLGAWLGGVIIDWSDGYRMLFLLSMILFAVAAEAYRSGSVLIRLTAGWKQSAVPRTNQPPR